MKTTVCMLVSNEVRPDPRVTKEAKALAGNWDVYVVGQSSLSKHSAEKSEFGYWVLLVKAPFKNGKQRSTFSKALSKLIASFRMARQAYRVNARVYHAHDFDMLPFAYVVARLRRAKLIYDSHELWVEQRADFPAWFKKTVMKIERYLIRKTDAVITVNESISAELENRYKLKSSPIILHNFSELTDFERKTDIPNAGHKKTVLYHGGYMRDRGLEEIVEGSKMITKNIAIHFRGMGPIEEDLKNLASETSGSNIEFLQPVPMKQLINAAQNADIGIIPYKPTCLNNYYSLPNKLSEYAMAGLAICASDLPEIRRLNDKYQFGELFDPSKPESIAAAINKLASDANFLESCRRNARAWAEGSGNWESEQPKLIGLYKELIGESHEKTLDY